MLDLDDAKLGLSLCGTMGVKVVDFNEGTRIIDLCKRLEPDLSKHVYGRLRLLHNPVAAIEIRRW